MLTFNSNAPTLIPAAAPDPANPTKCSLPILLANNDIPTYGRDYKKKGSNYDIIQSNFKFYRQ